MEKRRKTMRMILVHGINQEGQSAQKIHDDWLEALRATYAKHGPDPLHKLSRIDAAFYGDTLHQLSSAKFKDQAIALGADDTPDDFDEFARFALEEMALRMGATK